MLARVQRAPLGTRGRTTVSSVPGTTGATRGKRGGRGLLTSMRQRWPLTMGLLFVGLLCLVTIGAPLLAPASPDVQNMSNVLKSPSAEHPFGTDEFGRDLLSRVLYGGRVTLLASTLSVLIAALSLSLARWLAR